MKFIDFGSRRIEYRLKKSSRRKTLTINITPSAEVIVHSPNFLNEEKVKDIVRKKALWIFEKQDYFTRLKLSAPEKEFTSGEQVLLLGRKYRLKVRESNNGELFVPEVIGRKIYISVKKDLCKNERKKSIRKILIDWYVSRAKEIIEKRVERYSRLIGVSAGKVIIKEQKKRWGSCSGNGKLRFNWKIIIAPVSVVDYVVVHELSHLKIKNHSSGFWKLISLVLPDYQERREWLKDNAAIFKI